MSVTKNILIWVLALVLMVVIVIYQRTTGPTYPKSGETEIQGSNVTYKLLRSHEVGIDAPVKVENKDKSLVARIKLKRYPSHDEWSEFEMSREGEFLVSSLPKQLPAGKVMYQIMIGKDYNNLQELIQEPIILRYKGAVPDWVLYPHIAFMILSFAFAMRVALEAAFKGNNTLSMAYWTLGFFAFGGLVLGPIVQWYAFGAFWTGWPFGKTILHFGDLTDNKTLASILIWIIAIVRMRKHPKQTWWAWLATIVMIIV
ncbi:MAG: hypothetical protein WC970_04895, partial [Dehalococcoidales bacterium]